MKQWEQSNAEETEKEYEKMVQWEENAKVVEQIYGEFVDWEERFYLCPDCEEPVYECDWSNGALKKFLCPICEFREGRAK